VRDRHDFGLIQRLLSGEIRCNSTSEG
jgi:hypothetical protein